MLSGLNSGCVKKASTVFMAKSSVARVLALSILPLKKLRRLGSFGGTLDLSGFRTLGSFAIILFSAKMFINVVYSGFEWNWLCVFSSEALLKPYLTWGAGISSFALLSTSKICWGANFARNSLAHSSPLSSLCCTSIAPITKSSKARFGT